MSKKLHDQLFNLKFTAKQLGRNSKKALKNEKAEKKKLKKAIEKGNTDGARIYAQNAIREKNQALNMLRLQSRVVTFWSKLRLLGSPEGGGGQGARGTPARYGRGIHVLHKLHRMN